MAKFPVAPVLLVILFLLSATSTTAARVVEKTETTRTASEDMRLPVGYEVIIEEVKIIQPNPNVDQQQRNMNIQQKPRNTYVYHETDNNNQAMATTSSSMENVLMCVGQGSYCNPLFGPQCCSGKSACLNYPGIPVGGICLY